MGWLVQRKHDRSRDIGRIERHLELVEVVFLFLLVAAVAGENDARSRQAGLHLVTLIAVSASYPLSDSVNICTPALLAL